MGRFKVGGKWVREINILNNVKRFIIKIRTETRLFEYGKLNEFHLALVNDKSSHQQGVKSRAKHL